MELDNTNKVFIEVWSLFRYYLNGNYKTFDQKDHCKMFCFYYVAFVSRIGHYNNCAYLFWNCINYIIVSIE